MEIAQKLRQSLLVLGDAEEPVIGFGCRHRLQPQQHGVVVLSQRTGRPRLQWNAVPGAMQARGIRQPAFLDGQRDVEIQLAVRYDFPAFAVDDEDPEPETLVALDGVVQRLHPMAGLHTQGRPYVVQQGIGDFLIVLDPLFSETFLEIVDHMGRPGEADAGHDQAHQHEAEPGYGGRLPFQVSYQ